VTLTERPATMVRALHDGVWHPADEVARGAAFELFADSPGPSFLPNPRPGARHPYRRFVHRSEILAVTGPVTTQTEAPLLMPVSRTLDWATVHRMSQCPAGADPLVAAIRRTAAIRRGTRMVKPLSAGQVVGHLRGWLPAGFCYREYDVAHLRTPADLNVLLGEGGDDGAAFALRWRAIDAGDYEIPSLDAYPGLVRMPPHDRAGPPVIGSGFAPAERHLVPEFVTADLADLPLPAGASLVAYTADGTEVTLYTYLPEQRTWTRMFGPQWRHLLAGAPEGFSVDREHYPVPAAPSRFVGTYRGEWYDAIADPPADFRLASKIRAARYPVETLARRCPYTRWRGVACTVVRHEAGWLRVRLCRPDAESVTALAAQCVERGVYETWAPAAEATDAREVDTPYPL
jgi:hypothetical protein